MIILVGRLLVIVLIGTIVEISSVTLELVSSRSVDIVRSTRGVVSSSLQFGEFTVVEVVVCRVEDLVCRVEVCNNEVATAKILLVVDFIALVVTDVVDNKG